ncbi:MAG: SCO family protein [Planctomycetota bacterium]|nr:SCO family protein [Planctomycetota bacterium]
MRRPGGKLSGTVAAALLALLAAAPGRAQDPWGLPRELEGVGIDPRPDAQVPLDAVLRDEQGTVVRMGDYFDGRRPVVLILSYYRCPMLCGLVLDAALDAFKGLAWAPGEEFEVVTLSIDARETPELARGKKEHTLAALGRPGAERGWHFLTGSERSIAAISEAVGFSFRYLPERNDFAHAAGIFVLTTDGRVSQTLTGLTYEPRTLRLALVEASDGKIGGLLDQVLLFCFHYDPKSGTYTPVVMNIVRLAAGVTVLCLGTLVGTLLWRERRQARAARPEARTVGLAPDVTRMGTP